RSSSRGDSPERSLERPTAQNVQMRVEDDLTALLVHVHRDAVAGQPVLRREALRGEQQRAGEASVTGRKIVQRREMPLRYHERVKRRLRMNVLEREQRVVLVETLGGNLSRDDLAEKAVRLVHPRCSCASILRRPANARESVPPSMNSSSPPTGTP